MESRRECWQACDGTRGQIGLLPMPRPVFGTATLLTSTSWASMRAEGVFWPVFGTATLPTGTPEASPRGEGVFWPVFGTGTMPTGTPVASRRAEQSTISLKPASKRTSTGLRHGDHAHRYSRAILAWRTGNLSTLRPDLRPCSWPLRLGCVLGHDSGLNPGH